MLHTKNSGRLDKLLYVPLPSPADRAAILKTVAKKVNLSDDVDLDEIAHSSRSDGYSGADCAALLREAGLGVLRKSALDIPVTDSIIKALKTGEFLDLEFPTTQLIMPPYQKNLGESKLSHLKITVD